MKLNTKMLYNSHRMQAVKDLRKLHNNKLRLEECAYPANSTLKVSLIDHIQE